MMCLWQNSLTMPVTSYANAGGTGNRTATITVNIAGSLPAPVGGTLSNIVNGDFSANNTGSCGVGSGTTAFSDGDAFEYVFPSLVFIDEWKAYMDRAISWGSWKNQYWDGAAFQDLNSFTWNSQTQTQAVTGMPFTGTTKLRVMKVGAASGLVAPYYEEKEFKIAAAAT